MPQPEDRTWRIQAACRGTQRKVIDSKTKTERTISPMHPDPSDYWGNQWAKGVCGTCPVRAQCLEHALVYSEPVGIWGGYDQEELDALRRRRRSNIRRSKHQTRGLME